MDNEIIERFIMGYANNTTRKTVISHLQTFYLYAREKHPNFTYDTLFKMDSIKARDFIWSLVLEKMSEEQYGTATQFKVYAKTLYDFAHEKDGQVINYRRNMTVPKIKTREVEIPTHEQIWSLIDGTTHLKMKSMLILSYVSGIKGEALRNLRISDIDKAIKYQDEIKAKLELEINQSSDKETLKDLQYLLDNLPLVIKITPELYPKRFRGQTNEWYPALVSKDAQEILLKHYNKMKTKGETLLYPTGTGKKYSQVNISARMKYNIDKYAKSHKGDLANTSPSMIRKAFYNRLISKNMKDIHREFIMGHSLQVKSHYFNWDLQYTEILLSYVKCNFNRNGSQVYKEVNTLKKESISSQEKIKQLEQELAYFKSPEFSKKIVDSIFSGDIGKTIEVNEPSMIKINKNDIDKYMELRKKGYKKTIENGTYVVMEKQ